MRTNLMSSSSMTPLSRTAAPRSPEETVEAGVLAAQQSRFVAADDDDDKDKKKKDDDKDSRGKKAADDDEKEKDKKKDDDKKDSKSKKAAEDDDDDAKKKKTDAAKAIRAAERARMLAIIDSPAGRASFAANPEKTLRFVLMHSRLAGRGDRNARVVGGGWNLSRRCQNHRRCASAWKMSRSKSVRMLLAAQRMRLRRLLKPSSWPARNVAARSTDHARLTASRKGVK